MLIIGARMRTPATWVSNTRSNSPEKCDTSVEVPPMSKPITRSKPASWLARTMPTMPPAGPDRMLSLPWKARASVRPPFDCMNCRFTPGIWPATWST